MSEQIVYVESKSNGMAIASLVLGIVGTLGALIPIMFFVGWGLGVTGLVLGLVALSKSKRLGGVRRAMSKWGIALSIAAVGLGTVGFVIVQNAVDELDKDMQSISTEMDSYSECLNQADTMAEIEAC